MTRIAILATGLVAVLALAGPSGAGPQAPQATKIVGVTGPGFTITLKKGGKLVKTLPHASTRSPFRTSRASTTSGSRDRVV